MSTRRRRPAAAVSAVVLLTLAPLVAVRPVAAAQVDAAATTVTSATPEGYATYGVTALASGVRTSGDVGASGGLVTLDTASGSVRGRLDSAPSSSVLASPYDPGTLFRTVVGQANDGAGQEVFAVPEAEAAYPGVPKGDLDSVPSTSAGPVTGSGGTAHARATASTFSGDVTGQSLDVAGVLTSEGSTGEVTASADAATGRVTVHARTAVARVVVAGVLELRDVVAVADVTTSGDTHTPTVSLTIGGASVAGQSVGITDAGVVAAGMPVVPATTLQQATDQANAVLANAGIRVSLTGARRVAGPREATADTGGVLLTLTTPDLPGAVQGNALRIVVGGVSVTETDTLPVALPTIGGVTPGQPSVGGVPPVTTTTLVPGTPGIPGTPAIPGLAPPAAGSPPVQVAAPEVLPTSFAIVGRELSATAALAAFGIWQFLTLGSVSLYAFVDRRRRQQLAEAAS